MDTPEPAIDLILSQVDDPGECAVCERTATSIWCDSCEPPHYLCRDCIGPHRDDFNHVLG